MNNWSNCGIPGHSQCGYTATWLCDYAPITRLYLCGYTAAWLYECMAVWLRGLVDGYVPTCYWIQTLLVTLCVTGS